MITTSNSHEKTLSILQSDGTQIEACIMLPAGKSGPEFILALNDQYGNPLQEIVLSVAQALALRAHLNSLPA